MHIDSISNTINNRYNFNKSHKKQTAQTNANSTIPFAVLAEYPIPFLGTPRVDKRLPRFENFNDQQKRLTTTLKNYLATIEDKLSITPSEAMKNAYANLNIAKNIEDVQRLFPDEELFIYLTTLKETASKRGIIGIYKEFEDIFKNGILKSGEDFTIYLLRKLFIETKVYNDINTDLDNDLIPDIKKYFNDKYDSNEYVTTEVLKALEIYPPDQDMRNSLKFTKEGYADLFGLTMSISQLRRINKLSEEEREYEINNRCQGLEGYWNDLTYDEKLELIAGVDSQDEVYKNYRKYANANRKKNREYINSLPEFEQAAPKKKVKTNIKLNDKELFILWMQRKLAKCYENLTDEEKEILSVKRSKRQAQRWKEMSPEEKTEYINKIRAGAEPNRYALIDAWNHSRILIRALSEFLKEQQILKPVDLIYASKEFSEFQSRIMTEFWAGNRDLADDFGKTLKYSHQKVEDAIKNGTFEQLKKDILFEKEERVKILAIEYQADTEDVKEAEEEKIKEKEAIMPKNEIIGIEEFADIYKKSIDKFNVLPASYFRKMTDIIFEKLPQETIIKYGNAIKNNEPISQDIKDSIKITSPEMEKLNRTLETAIAAELVSRGASPDLFELDIDSLIPVLNEKYNNNSTWLTKKIDAQRIERLFNEYNKNLTDKELNILANRYFATVEEKSLTQEQNNEVEEYLNTYGSSLLILFSDKSAFSDEVKIHFNNKFLKLMPENMKEYFYPYIQTPEDIAEETEIGNLTAKIYKRFKYIPDDILKIYTREIAYAIRMDRRNNHKQNWLKEFQNVFSTRAAYNMGQTFPNMVVRILSGEDKLKIIAIEQAMADEFYRITKNNEAYSKSFEQLLNFFDMLSVMKKNEKLDLTTEDDSMMFSIKEKPNTKSIFTRYLKYMNALNANKNLINSDKKLVIPELLNTLNPDVKQSSKNNYITKRIMPYFMSEEEFMDREASRIDKTEYRKDFILEFKRRENKYNLLPPNYIRDISNIILDTFPREFIEKYTMALGTNSKIPEDIAKTLADEGTKNNNPQLARHQRALEAAIALELVNKGGAPLFFDMTIDTLIPIYEVRARNTQYKKLDIDMIQRLYNDFKKDLTKEELENIVNHYFVTKDPDPTHSKENDQILMDYLNEYGRSLDLLFTNTNDKFPSKIKDSFNSKFLKLMPQNVKNVAKPLLANADDIEEENELNIVRNQIAKRFNFIPKKALDTYTQEVATCVRVYKQPEANENDRENYSIEKVKRELCNKRVNPDDGISILRIPKYTLNTSSKLTLLAAEQAMADELCRLSGKNLIYKYELEDLATWFEMSSSIKKRDSSLEISNDEGDLFLIKQKPNINNVAMKFNQYMEEFSTREDLYLANGEIDKEIILYCLNPEENNKLKDENTIERINKYFVD